MGGQSCSPSTSRLPPARSQSDVRRHRLKYLNNVRCAWFSYQTRLESRWVDGLIRPTPALGSCFSGTSNNRELFFFPLWSSRLEVLPNCSSLNLFVLVYLFSKEALWISNQTHFYSSFFLVPVLMKEWEMDLFLLCLHVECLEQFALL